MSVGLRLQLHLHSERQATAREQIIRQASSVGGSKTDIIIAGDKRAMLVIITWYPASQAAQTRVTTQDS